MKIKVDVCHLRISYNHSKCTEGIIEELLINILLTKQTWEYYSVFR